MAGPTSPGTEGPTFAPPHLPPGWIAQWDGTSKKYYFVQLSTGVSQWEVPTDAAPTGSTPAPVGDHPYGVPRQQELITHPDGSQTVRHADGTMEPVNPPMPPDGTNTRGLGGPGNDRGLGSMAMNALLGGKDNGQGQGGSGMNFGNLAGHLMGGSNSNDHGGNGNGNGNSGHTASGGGKHTLGKIGGALASSFLHTSGDKPSHAQNSQGGGQTSGNQHHGLAGSLMGGVANMFGNSQAHQSNNFGYTNSGSTGPYTGQPPTASYQPPGLSSSTAAAAPGSGTAYSQSGASQGNTQQATSTTGTGHSTSFEGPPSGQQTFSAYGQMAPPPPSAGPPPIATYGPGPTYNGAPQPAPTQHYGGPTPYGSHFGGAATPHDGLPDGRASFRPNMAQHPGQGYGQHY